MRRAGAGSFSLHVKDKGTAFCLLLALGLPLGVAGQTPGPTKPKGEPSFVGKIYQNTHAYFNGYYHAYALYKEATAQLEAASPPESGLLSLISLPDIEALKTDNRLQQAIQKCELVLFRRSRSDWVDDCRLLMGKCYYYRGDFVLAQKNLQYIGVAQPKSELVPESLLWLAKLYLAQNDRYSARQQLDLLFRRSEIPDPVRAESALLFAQVLLQEGKRSEAIKALDDNLKTLTDRTQRARAHFVLGQLYQALNAPTQALYHYTECAGLKATPGLTFSAELALIGMSAQSGTDEAQRASSERELRKLLEDSRFEPYHEQVYYQLALLRRKGRQYEPALEALRLGLAANRGSRHHKLRSYTLCADIYFEDLKKWPRAQAYYDSARVLVLPDDPDFARIRALSSSLEEFSRLSTTLARNDSLLDLALQPDFAIEQRIKFAIAAEAEAQERAQRQAQTAAAPRLTETTVAAEGAFYFDNEAALAQGRAAFARTWGPRPNRDNWRRAAAGGPNAQPQPRETETPTATSTAPNAPTDYASQRARLYGEIPFSEAAKAELREGSLSAMLGLALIYADKLDRPDLASSLYESIIGRDPTHELAVRARYGLYVLLRNWEPTAAERWGDEIVRDFPRSDYARLVLQARSPGQPVIEYSDEDEAYTTLYGLYQKADYTTVVNFVNYMLAKAPAHPLAAQMLYLKGLSQGRMGLRDSLVATYRQLVQLYPSSSVAARAKGTLEFAENPERSTATGTPPRDNRPPTVENQPYATTLRANDVVLVVLFIDKGTFDAGQIVRDLNGYHKTTFPDRRINVNAFDYQGRHLVYIDHFKDFRQANTYLETLAKVEGLRLYFKSVPEQGLFIAQSEFRKVFTQRKFDDYQRWYNAHIDDLLGN